MCAPNGFFNGSSNSICPYLGVNQIDGCTIPPPGANFIGPGPEAPIKSAVAHDPMRLHSNKRNNTKTRNQHSKCLME